MAQERQDELTEEWNDDYSTQPDDSGDEWNVPSDSESDSELHQPRSSVSNLLERCNDRLADANRLGRDLRSFADLDFIDRVEYERVFDLFKNNLKELGEIVDCIRNRELDGVYELVFEKYLTLSRLLESHSPQKRGALLSRARRIPAPRGKNKKRVKKL